jgi:hypothetical protein
LYEHLDRCVRALPTPVGCAASQLEDSAAACGRFTSSNAMPHRRLGARARECLAQELGGLVSFWFPSFVATVRV